MRHLDFCRELGRAHHQMARAGRASSSALDAPVPRDGEVLRTALPDTWDGIRFEIGRMRKYVQDARRDPVMLEHCREVCGQWMEAGREEAELDKRPFDRKRAYLDAVEAWCRAHYVYVNDPPNIEVIQPPRRMIKWTRVPPEVIGHIMAPLAEAIEGAVPSFKRRSYVPPPLCPGDCDEGSTLMLGHCVCIPVCMGEEMGPFRFRFGGNDGTLHHVWAYIHCGGKWYDCDLTEPSYRLGDHSGFDAYEEVEVPL